MKNEFSIGNLNDYPIAIIQHVEYNSGDFSYHRFPNDNSKLDLLKQLKIYSKTESVCHPLLYKKSSGSLLDYCNVIGFNLYSEEERTALQLLIETVNSELIIPINSIYLKEMQKPSFGTTAYKEG